jgi:uncharacterized iron-regulated protein
MSQNEVFQAARRRGGFGLALIALGGCCGGTYAAANHSTTVKGEDGADPGPLGVEAAALPYRIVDARTGHEVAAAEFEAALDGAQAICIGEDHPNPHHHWAQLHLLDQVSQRAGAGGGLGLGFEMFQTPFQGVLDDYGGGRIDEATLLSRTAWEDRWGFDYDLYRPMVKLAVERGVALIALNTPRETTKKVSREGLDKLTDAERAALPQLVLDDPDHRAWFEALMSSMGSGHGHGHGHGEAEPTDGEHAPAEPDAEKDKVAGAGDDNATAERIYTAQVLWDETMADGAARWVSAAPGRRILILAGNGHCHESAMVRRLERRGVPQAISVRPIIDDGANVAAELVKPMTDFLFVMSMPAAP